MKLVLLESVVSAAVGKLQQKPELWGNGPTTVGTDWERPGALGDESLEEMLNAIDLDYLAGKNEWAVVGIGWEILGLEAPEKIQRKRDELWAKADAGLEPLTRIEELWFDLLLTRKPQ